MDIRTDIIVTCKICHMFELMSTEDPNYIFIKCKSYELLEVKVKAASALCLPLGCRVDMAGVSVAEWSLSTGGMAWPGGHCQVDIGGHWRLPVEDQAGLGVDAGVSSRVGRDQGYCQGLIHQRSKDRWRGHSEAVQVVANMAMLQPLHPWPLLSNLEQPTFSSSSAAHVG